MMNPAACLDKLRGGALDRGKPGNSASYKPRLILDMGTIGYRLMQSNSFK
jgi:hypothetical protein